MTRLPDRYTDAQLRELYRSLAGHARLFLPLQRDAQQAHAIGPVFQIRVKYSELFPERDTEQAYWELLQRIPKGGVAVLSAVSNVLALQSAQDQAPHRVLEDHLVAPALRAAIRNRVQEPRAFSVLVGHLSASLAMSHLLTFGNDALDAQEETDELRHLIGELFLFSNEFFERERVIPGVPSDVDLMLVSMPTWDLSNRRDLAYTVTQAYSVLDIALTSTAPHISALRRAAFGAVVPLVDGLPVTDFVAIIFGLFASARSTIERLQLPRIIFDRQTLMRDFPAAQTTLDTILTTRSKTAAEFRTAFGGETPGHDEFLAQVRERRFLANHLRIFRSTPLLRLNEQQVAVLDIQFLAELMSQGVYWVSFRYACVKRCGDS